jgi:hypothetical protein
VPAIAVNDPDETGTEELCPLVIPETDPLPVIIMISFQSSS